MSWPLPSRSSATLGTPLKSRTTIIVVASFLAIIATYKIFGTGVFVWSSQKASSIHRSNAIRRRQRARTIPNEGDNIAQPFHAEDSDQADELRFATVDQNIPENENITENSASQEEYTWSLPQEYERNGQNIVQLLFRVSEDATKRNAYVHRGCACNCCGMVPIRGIRYRCANCADYDLCESCEAQGVHIKTHIFYKIRVPASAIGPRNMQPVWYLGDPDSVTRQLPREIITKLSRETGFERPEIDAQWEQWTFMANTDWRDDPHEIYLAMDRKTFERCLVPSGGYRHVSPCLIFDRMFAFYDTNKDDLIGFPEFLHGIAFRKKKDKWKKIFEGYDIDGDGYVDRKDFLRIFRSYYVLYRTMHADMLEGMVEQQMSSADAHRLINSRQPLSSAFGQDGRFPRAPDPRTGEGKVLQENGELEIVDGKGVINESSQDHGNREEVFKNELLKQNWSEGRFNSRGYWEMILNPPDTGEQLWNMLRDVEVTHSQVIDELTAAPNSTHEHVHEQLDLLTAEGRRMLMLDDDNDDSHSDSDNDSWPPSFVQITDEDAEAVDGPGTRVADVRNYSRREVISHALLRIRDQRDAILRYRTQRDVYERWQRRQFYTEEEEGGKPPADWKDDYDVLARNGISGESSKSSRPLLHSRSSSKVHFAEDMNDFDTRSNPSTSSRSVPERWGGIEIPDAERDAGKEILYQVTQQAFNELLDPLFKEKEDLAIEAAALKFEREKYRDLYNRSDFQNWAIYQTYPEVIAAKKAAKKGEMNMLNKQIILQTRYAALFQPEWVREEPHQEPPVPMIFRFGRNNRYEEAEISENGTQNVPETIQGVRDNSNVLQDHSNSESTHSCRYTHQQAAHFTESSGIITHDDNDHRTSHIAPPCDTSYDENFLFPEMRDPTMPQFRPNSLLSPSITSYDEIPVSTSHQVENLANGERNWLEKETQHLRPSNPTPESEEQTKIEQSDEKNFKRAQEADEYDEDGYEDGVPRSKLFRCWLCERAAVEAEERGGWGRLNFREFENAVKKEIEKEKGQRNSREKDNALRMDYLGSWIEFCIP